MIVSASAVMIKTTKGGAKMKRKFISVVVVALVALILSIMVFGVTAFASAPVGGEPSLVGEDLVAGNTLLVETQVDIGLLSVAGIMETIINYLFVGFELFC